jgi:uncharacterized protein (TIGR03118 family)
VEVYDATFKPVSMSAGAFTDPTIPAGFAPFNVQNIDGNLFVSFAMQKQPDRHDEADGPGLGYVDVFDGSGVLLNRLEHGKWMNAPWGHGARARQFRQMEQPPADWPVRQRRDRDFQRPEWGV